MLLDLLGDLTIVDFGISREIDLNQTKTYETFVRGTLFWLPPGLAEHFGGKGKVKKNDCKDPFRDPNNPSFKHYYDNIAFANFRLTLNDP